MVWAQDLAHWTTKHPFQPSKDQPDYCKCGAHKAHPEHEQTAEIERSRSDIAYLKYVSYKAAAGAICNRCAEGDEPRWMAVFQGMTHVWKTGNGHSQCSAGPIWEKLILPMIRPDATRTDSVCNDVEPLDSGGGNKKA